MNLGKSVTYKKNITFLQRGTTNSPNDTYHRILIIPFEWVVKNFKIMSMFCYF